MIMSSEHFVAFTGAGISTGAGIPDYRSGANTKLKTGAGCWEKAANIAKARKENKAFIEPTKKNFNTTIAEAVPTKTHMSLVTMMEKGILKHIISQNIDNLHIKSGIPPQNITEVHGNRNIEFCEDCGVSYIRD